MKKNAMEKHTLVSVISRLHVPATEETWQPAVICNTRVFCRGAVGDVVVHHGSFCGSVRSWCE